MIYILENLIDNRKKEISENSYINSLLKKGVKEISKKVTEEAGETAIAAVTDDGRLIDESADLLFHLIVLLKSQELSFDDVLKELKKRSANQ
jgi:phosphoribosyl-ATP pyrophosphohydrolase/phosphoribosyl-AMP cyclohydrolase